MKNLLALWMLLATAERIPCAVHASHCFYHGSAVENLVSFTRL